MGRPVGRKPIGERAMTATERTRRRRLRFAKSGLPPHDIGLLEANLRDFELGQLRDFAAADDLSLRWLADRRRSAGAVASARWKLWFDLRHGAKGCYLSQRPILGPLAAPAPFRFVALLALRWPDAPSAYRRATRSRGRSGRWRW